MRKGIFLLVFFFFFIQNYAFGIDCNLSDFSSLGLKDEEFSKPVQFEKVEAGQTIGNTPVKPHCAIKGKMWPEIGFAIKLPKEWNGRLVVVGCGGACGSIPEGSMIRYLNEGYAVAGDDSGHSGSSALDWSFAYNPPDNSNPFFEQKLKDHGYRSIHETFLLAKNLVKAYYGMEPFYSYYVGASTGGRQGLMNAQRYADFDGYLVGMPVREITKNAMKDTWAATLFFPNFPPQTQQKKMNILAQRVYEKCDGLDGLKDGIISEPEKCPFNPLTDLPACEGEEDREDCFTTVQRETLKKLYEGPKDESGNRLFCGMPIGGEALMKGLTGLASNFVAGIQLGLGLGGNFQKFIVMRDPNFDPMTYNLEKDYKKSLSEDLRKILDATDPDLSKLRGKGSKIINWHGLADTLVPAFQSISYYEEVMKTLGKKETTSFYKLYLVPGLSHGYGIGPFADFFPQLVKWVEKGEEPKEVIGKRDEDPQLGLKAMTRPLCPYPQFAKYKGEGDPMDAANFTCAEGF